MTQGGDSEPKPGSTELKHTQEEKQIQKEHSGIWKQIHVHAWSNRWTEVERRIKKHERNNNLIRKRQLTPYKRSNLQKGLKTDFSLENFRQCIGKALLSKAPEWNTTESLRNEEQAVLRTETTEFLLKVASNGNFE